MFFLTGYFFRVYVLVFLLNADVSFAVEPPKPTRELNSWCPTGYAKLDNSTRTRLIAPSQQSIPESTLRLTRMNGKSIIEFFSQNAKLNELFNKGAGVKEGYSIREHTLMVYDVFNEIRRFFPLQNRITKDGTNLEDLTNFIIALHDIGKPVAIKNEGKHLQHEYTLPIIQDIMKTHGFQQNDVNVISSLIGNDVLGNLMKGTISPQEAFRRLNSFANDAGMNPSDFFQLQAFFYTIDAASYPLLRAKIFQSTTDGRLIPNSPRFEELQSMYQSLQ